MSNNIMISHKLQSLYFPDFPISPPAISYFRFFISINASFRIVSSAKIQYLFFSGGFSISYIFFLSIDFHYHAPFNCIFQSTYKLQSICRSEGSCPSFALILSPFFKYVCPRSFFYTTPPLSQNTY